ncbi:MAG: Fic family protein [Methanocorpusculum sp.]|nr:Fic family protein [Methanocorpusculum sp.]
MRNYYKIGLTYSSNALEGNSLTESETKIVLEDGLTIDGKPLRDIYEAVGHAKAYEYLYSIAEKQPITLDHILTIHKLFYSQIDEKRAGKFRESRVFISGSRYPLPNPEKLKSLMNDFVEWFNSNESILHPVEFAALVHLKFVFIHPFIDGNGRVARLLMNLALLRNGYTITVIPPILRREYIESLETAHKDTEQYCIFIARRVVETQKELLRLLGETE